MVETKTDELTDLLSELGISRSDGNSYALILYNDDVNEMGYVAQSLFDICEIPYEKAVQIMIEAHTKGKAIAKVGSQKEMAKMKDGLNKRHIEAGVEEQ